LYAVEVPEVGGDTMWSSMTSAYASLAPKLQAYLDGMVAVHDWEAPALVDNVKGKPDGEALYQDIRRKYPPIGQPVILRHPVTDKPLVFVNALYTTRIEKLSQAESTSLVAFLTGLARVPEWQVRFRWRKGSVAIWDNLATQHYAVNDYFPAPRTMHRVSIR
jgi:taurine dioxygenase